MRIVLLVALVVVALVAWDAMENDGEWGRIAGQTVDRAIDRLPL